MGNPAGVRRDFDALEKRRFAAMRLLEEGLNQSEAARRVKVARQTVARWQRQCRAEGKGALKKAGRAGRRPLLSDKQRQALAKLLVEGPEKLGYETPLWTCPRVAHLIAQKFDVNYHPGHVWKSGESRVESATAYGTGSGTRRGTDPPVEKENLARDKKKPVKKGVRLSSSTKVE